MLMKVELKEQKNVHLIINYITQKNHSIKQA
jgi:hypothetical protein